MIRYLRGSEGRPLLDILAVAILVGVTRQRFRLSELGAVAPSTRRLANALVVVAIAAWAGGIWVEHNSADGGATILGGGIGAAAVVSILEMVRYRARNPRGARQATTARSGARNLMTIPALKTTTLCVACELVVVDWLGGLAMHRIGLSESYLTPLSVIVYTSAGFLARRRGASGAIAGAIVTTADAVGWLVSGGLTPEVTPTDERVLTVVSLLLVGLVGGAILGAIGGWTGGRTQRAGEPMPSK